MKRLLILCLLCAGATRAQQLTVTATVIDPNNHPWASGTAHASLVCTGNAQAYFGTTPIARDTPTVALDGNGKLTQQLYDTSQLVDVNHAPLACSYVYRITEQCQIANFSTGPLTGITGAGPVDVSAQVNQYTVPLSAQCTPAGGLGSVGWYVNNTLIGLQPNGDFDNGNNTTLTGINDPANHKVHITVNATGTGAAAIYQHNGVQVGQQPTFNVIDTGTVVATMVDDIANNRVNVSFTSSGGGTGCLPPGNDFGVLSEHPVGTCYDSAHWTWDDTTNRQVMQSGVGNTIASGTSLNDAYVFGPSNSVTGTAFSTSQVRVFGDNNIVGPATTTNENHIFGFSNTQNHVSDSWQIGNNNVTTDTGSNVFSFGSSNTAQSATPGSAVNIRDCFMLGENNLLQNITGAHTISNCFVAGFGNTINHANSGASSRTQNIFIGGENNTIHSTNASVLGMDQVHILGTDNLVEDLAGNVEEVEIVGEQNTVNGALSTVQILGLLNTATNVTPSSSTTSDATIVGVRNAISGAPTGTTTAAVAVGGGLSISNCADCFLFGRNGVTTSNNFLGLGLSATPELQVVTSGSLTTLRSAPRTFASLPTCAAGTEGGFAAVTDSSTITWGATITGGGGNHVLAYCDGTNWTVAAL